MKLREDRRDYLCWTKGWYRASLPWVCCVVGHSLSLGQPFYHNGKYRGSVTCPKHLEESDLLNMSDEDFNEYLEWLEDLAEINSDD